MARDLLCFGVVVALSACGGSHEYPEAPPPAVRAEVEKDESPPPGVIWREHVVEAVERGLGAFLQQLEVEPSLEQGRFLGFRIVSLRAVPLWDGVDLQPGDVVISVNGKPIERETQAFAVFQELKTAPRLVVAYRRGGEARQLSYQILARSAAASSLKSASE